MVVPIKGDQQHKQCELRSLPILDISGCHVEDGAETQNGEVKSGKVVVKEKLSLHEEEREIVQSPAKSQEAADFVVCLDGRVAKILEASLSSKDEEAAEAKIGGNSEG